jgi:hypothetical protein
MSEKLELCERFDEELSDIESAIDNIRMEFPCLNENDEDKDGFRANLIAIREEAQALIKKCGELLTKLK